MLVPNIVCSTEVCVTAVAALAAKEETLRATIVTRLVATAGAGLRRAARINLDHLDTTCLRLVAKKGVELVKAPTMEPSLSFALACGGTVPKVAQVLDNDGCPWLGVLHNAL